MLMNFSSKRKGVHATPVFFPGRTGHRAARINDSILVLGGTDKTGKFVNEVHRINCLNNKIDTLILENTISIEGFSLFSFQDTLFLWGGRRLREHTNLLLQFDGTKFAPVKQSGNVPAPRAFHASITFGGKYLILFGGSDQLSFYNDWNLLNLKTFEWKTLTPSLQIKESLNCSMVWANGRGILLVNETFDPSTATNIPNSFYEFYVNDFNKGQVKVLPLQLAFTNSIFQDCIFRHMTISQNNSILIFGGYHLNDPTQLHGHSYLLTLDPMKLEKSKIRFKQKSQFESIYHKNKLFIIGGVLSSNEMEHYVQIYENNTDKQHYRRHVCQQCRLYFDQEWFKSSKEVFPHSRVKEEYDYNYHPRIDNRILAKFSTYILKEVYAISLIIDTLRKFTATSIQLSFLKEKESFSRTIPQMVDEAHNFLRIGCDFHNLDVNIIVNEILMTKERQCQNYVLGKSELEIGILRLKMGLFRIGKSCIFSIRVSKDEVCVIYFSNCQLECTQTNFQPFTNYHYYYNLKTKESSSKNNRHIIIENLKKHGSSNFAQFEEACNHSLSMLVFCGAQLQSQFVTIEHNQDAQTGETYPATLAKEENRKAVNLIQLSFLPIPKSPTVFIDQNQVNFINIIQILNGDFKSRALQRINSFDQYLSNDIFQKIELFYYPSEYWFRRMLIYHSNRLIRHFQGNISVCGVIVLKPIVELDMSGNHFADLNVELAVKNIIKDLRNFKRTAPTY